MKNLILISFLVPAMAMAQSKEDYERAMSRFKHYYNKSKTEKLADLFLPDAKEFVEKTFGGEGPGNAMKEYGRIKSFSYLGVAKEDGVTIFKTEFEKQTVATSFTLEEGNKFGTFRFHTNTDEIEAMLRDS
ncbi:hypothetical protein [Polluticoccus soli]|uniref:hypothetical protein n=1 Tax=Polluticoccus soli TaxID=3034150 RepID=UPI0023E28E74|nr:hypothetical protein [Flavipsychrobacter sp. JY13-12]